MAIETVRDLIVELLSFSMDQPVQISLVREGSRAVNRKIEIARERIAGDVVYLQGEYLKAPKVSDVPKAAE